jgi:CO/xanthine dehydrogenase Mo-binding subunit
VAAPAVLNAYAKASGQRVRTVPLKNQRIRMV